MTIIVRPMQDGDARAFLEVHRASVHGLAVASYPLTIIENWAPLPITGEAIRQVVSNPENEIRLIAEQAGKIVGIGCLVPEKNELRACYVTPEAARQGVGSAIVHELERIASRLGLSRLNLDASVNAEAFYRSAGYSVIARKEHVLRSGTHMAWQWERT